MGVASMPSAANAANTLSRDDRTKFTRRSNGALRSKDCARLAPPSVPYCVSILRHNQSGRE